MNTVAFNLSMWWTRKGGEMAERRQYWWTCDGPKVPHNGRACEGQTPMFVDLSALVTQAMAKGWHAARRKHYCPTCWAYATRNAKAARPVPHGKGLEAWGAQVRLDRAAPKLLRVCEAVLDYTQGRIDLQAVQTMATEAVKEATDLSAV